MNAIHFDLHLKYGLYISGAVDDAKGFYARVGYRGKSSMHKELPLPGRVREFRLRKLEAELGDLEVGQVVSVDATGKIPPLF